MATVKVACHLCGDTEVHVEDIEIVLNAPDNLDVRFVHCDTVTRRQLNAQAVLVLRCLDVPIVDERPIGQRHCSCGLAMFNVGGMGACRNCDAPLPGLPPADRRARR